MNELNQVMSGKLYDWSKEKSKTLSPTGRSQMIDITVTNGGSIILLRPETPAALAWVEEHIGQDNGYQPYWPTIVCEARYAGDVVEGMIADGLKVSE